VDPSQTMYHATDFSDMATRSNDSRVGGRTPGGVLPPKSQSGGHSKNPNRSVNQYFLTSLKRSLLCGPCHFFQLSQRGHIHNLMCMGSLRPA